MITATIIAFLIYTLISSIARRGTRACLLYRRSHVRIALITTAAR